MEFYDAFKKIVLFFLQRDFLWNFRLPGEAQKIDRMMDCFAQRFCECNQGIFGDAGKFLSWWDIDILKKIVKNVLNFYVESCYVVSFAIIMLNTSLHNPSVKEKQTCDQFVKMCKETSKTELQDTMLKVTIKFLS